MVVGDHHFAAEFRGNSEDTLAGRGAVDVPADEVQRFLGFKRIIVIQLEFPPYDRQRCLCKRARIVKPAARKVEGRPANSRPEQGHRCDQPAVVDGDHEQRVRLLDSPIFELPSCFLPPPLADYRHPGRSDLDHARQDLPPVLVRCVRHEVSVTSRRRQVESGRANAARALARSEAGSVSNHAVERLDLDGLEKHLLGASENVRVDDRQAILALDQEVRIADLQEFIE